MSGADVGTAGLRMVKAYRVNQLGMTFVIGRDGSLRWRGVWGGEESELFPAIEEAATP